MPAVHAPSPAPTRRASAGRGHRCRGLAAGAAVAALLAVTALPPAAGAAVSPMSASMEAGLSEFSNFSQLAGQITSTTERAYDGTRSARATNTGWEGYARGTFDVAWSPGDDVHYSAAFFLAPGFKNAMGGPAALIRWDNYGARGSGGDIGGLVIYRGDKKLHLIRGGYHRGYEAQLITPVEMPEGRWVHLEVHQRLSAGADALNEVFMDGVLVGRTTVPNSYGRGIDRLRTGLVAAAGGSRERSITLFFDRVRVGTSRSGPLGG